jgi:hypothetical protein
MELEHEAELVRSKRGTGIVVEVPDVDASILTCPEVGRSSAPSR